MKLTGIIEAYRTGKQAKPASIGGENENRIETASKEKDPKVENNIFYNRLEANTRFNQKMIIVYLIILIAAFFLICSLIWYFRNDKMTVMCLLGGQGLSIALILTRMRQLYKDKVFTDHLLYMMSTLKTEEEKKKYLDAMLEFLKSK